MWMLKSLNYFKLRISLEQLQKLFFAAVFPIHFWTILIFLLNAPNPKIASEWGDFFGIISYLLLIAFMETVFIFIAVYLLMYLIPTRWGSERTYQLILSFLALIFFWALVGQLLNIVPIPKHAFFIWVGINLANTLLYRQIAQIGSLGFIALLVLGQLYWFSKGRIVGRLAAFMERAAELSKLYLAADCAALIYVIVRNL